MITISDIHGIRQYTLSQFIKVIAKWVALLIMIALIAGGFYLYYLSNKAEEYQTKMYAAQNKMHLLENEQTLLLDKIQTKTQELDSMNEHLTEIEDILGLHTNSDESLQQRTMQVKEKTEKTLHTIQTKKLSKKLSKKQFEIISKHIPSGKPIQYTRISSKFGYRKHPITHKRAFHAGLDLVAKTGTPVYATADGVISYAKRKGGYGKYILIHHPLGFKTAYGHLSRFHVKEGTYVHKGDRIAEVGNTGNTTGPHLHYEVFYLHKWLNPTEFLKWNPQTYTAIMRKEHKVNWKGMQAFIQGK